MFGNESYFLSQDQFVKDSFLLTASDQEMMIAFGNPANRPKNPKNAYIITTKENVTKHYEKIVHAVLFLLTHPMIYLYIYFQKNSKLHF